MAKKRITKKNVSNGNESKKKVRIGARIDLDLYIVCKMAYSRMGQSMESRIEDLLKKDVDVMSKTQWFKEMMCSDFLAKYVNMGNNAVVVSDNDVIEEEEKDVVDSQFNGEWQNGEESDENLQDKATLNATRGSDEVFK